MTCFWDGIMRALSSEDFNYINEKKTNRINFIKMLKNKNKLINNVLWNGKQLTRQEMLEHYQAIKDYNINGIGDGHLTSTCDSFLLLICELFRVDINHKYLNVIINYKNKTGPRKILRFKSNKGHFSN